MTPHSQDLGTGGGHYGRNKKENDILRRIEKIENVGCVGRKGKEGKN